MKAFSKRATQGSEQKSNPNKVEKPFVPAKEQELCLKLAVENDAIKIEAIAGSGKTSVLFYISESLEVPSMYVAFNKSMADEASEKFSPHVECKTMHSLAYRHVGHSYQHKLSRPVGKYRNVAGTGREITTYFKIPDFDLPSDQGVRKYVSKFYTGQIIKDTLSKFESSADDKLETKHIPSQHLKDLKDRFGGKLDIKKFTKMLLRFSDQLWEERIDKFSEVLCTHDTYLKLYQLSKPTIPDIEVLYCDEQQDSSDCFLDIIFNQKDVKRILVGDSRQAIYAWRGAVNAMKKVNYKRANLSKSFRYGDRIAKVASAVLRNTIQIEGLESLDTRVGDDAVDFDQPYTILFRTNTNLVFKAIDLVASGESVNINIDVKDFVEMVRSAEALHDGTMNKVKHEAIIPYTTWQEFTEEAEYTREFKRILRIVEDGDTDKVISTLHSHTNSKSAKVTLTTSHKAKGLEFSQVVLSDCFPSIYNNKGEYVGLREEEENLLYVAVTRAVSALQLNTTTKEILAYNNLSEEQL
ncbi:DNA helicase [Vibrio phage eugene 12A10]|uniref:DNA helicase n=1 Tax=Vibrio phage eugene 12A10 TaxID=573172 RepID=UPI000351FDAB|nr:DNA helicase [Vibrio phage eugene 12A10]AGN51499.1 hypothetical protein VPLG_00060 [Vibrio phage eugene 12A10]